MIHGNFRHKTGVCAGVGVIRKAIIICLFTRGLIWDDNGRRRGRGK